MTREKEFLIAFAGYECRFAGAWVKFLLKWAPEKELHDPLSWQLLSFYGDSWGYYENEM